MVPLTSVGDFCGGDQFLTCDGDQFLTTATKKAARNTTAENPTAGRTAAANMTAKNGERT